MCKWVYIYVHICIYAIIITSTIKVNLKSLKYTMKKLIRLLFSCNCETADNFFLLGETEAKDTMPQCKTWVKLAGALIIKVVLMLLFQSGLSQRRRPLEPGILIIIHGMLFSVAMVLCILISVLT